MSTAEAVRGRPRDPTVDIRIREATLDLYGSLGWQGYTLDAVAKEAKVGKSALYRRWANKGELLLEVLGGLNDVAAVNTGSLREDLRALTHHFVDAFFGPSRLALLRYQVESAIIPELVEVAEAQAQRHVPLYRHIVRRAIDRGEITQDASPTVLMAMLYGAVMVHSLAYPQYLDEKVRQELPTFIDRLVDSLVRACETA